MGQELVRGCLGDVSSRERGHLLAGVTGFSRSDNRGGLSRACPRRGKPKSGAGEVNKRKEA